MAKGQWKVFSDTINGELKYRVGRKLRDNEPLHSGNVEYFSPRFYDSKSVAKYLANLLNSSESFEPKEED